MKTKTSFIIILLLCINVIAQVHMKKIEITGDDIFILQELGLVLSGENNNVTVATLLPVETRPREFQNIEIHEGDTIIMFNRKKIKTAGEIQKLYDALVTDDQIRLGIRRDDQMHLIECKKMDSSALNKGGKRMMIIKDTDGPDDGPAQGMKEKKIFKNADNIVLLPVEGIIMEEKENSLVVIDVIPHEKTIFGNSLIKAGCKLVSINDKEVTGKSQFESVYNKINTGDSITLLFSTESDTLKVEYPKPEAQEIKVIKK